MNTILACVDFSALTDRMIETVVDLARPCGASVHLLHVVGKRPEKAEHVVSSESSPDLARRRREAQRDLDKLAAELVDQGLDVKAVIAQGAVVDAIVEHAGKVDADMLVMGSHGTGAVYHLVVGSVAGGVLDHMDTPVLLVPAREAEKIQPPAGRRRLNWFNGRSKAHA